MKYNSNGSDDKNSVLQNEKILISEEFWPKELFIKFQSIVSCFL